MNIAVFTPTYAPQQGGVERAVHEIFSRIADDGHEVHIFTPRRVGGLLYEEDCGFHIHRSYSPPNLRAGRFVLHQFGQLRDFLKSHRRKAFDVALLNYAAPACLIQPFIQARTKVIIYEHHLGTGLEVEAAEENPAILRPLLRWSYERADRLIATSLANKTFVENISGRRCGTLSLGVDTTRFHPRNRSDSAKAQLSAGTPALLSVSRLVKRKRVDDLISLAEDLVRSKQHFQLTIAGTGPEKTRLEAEVAERGLVNYVKFLGFVPDEQLPALVASADIFLSASAFEGFGLAVAEAMASGVPVVARDAGGTAEFLHHGVNGYVSQTPAEMRTAVVSLLQNHAHRADIAERGWSSIQRLTWARAAEQMLAELEGLAYES